MKTRQAVLSLCVLLAAASTLLAEPEESVVRVIATPRRPDPVRPWAKPMGAESGGAGVVIDGQRILTSAHVILYSTEIHVQARPGDDKFEAQVVALDRNVDLALLTVKDKTFFAKKPPLPLSERLPRVQDAVTVYGFPIGGNDLSITKGEVSRIEFMSYGSRGVGSVVQISAPVNPGNSGGPAVGGGKIVGLVQSGIIGAQNIGFLVPSEEIHIFLDDLKDGHYDGKPIDATFALYQPLENLALRRLLKLDANVKGVLVQSPRRPGKDFPFKPADIVTRIGEHDIDNTGNVLLAGGLRAPFLYVVPRLAKDGRVPLTVWRNGQTVHVPLPVTTADNRLIPDYGGEPMRYFIHGPLVFAPARAEDMFRYSQMNRFLASDNSPLITRRFDMVRFPGEELVVVSAPIFKHKIAKGYGDPAAKVVDTVNGVRIKNLSHLVETLRDCTEEFVTLRFADEWSEVLVFDRQELEQATEEILEDNGIAATRRGSPDVLKLWKAKGARPR
jgi:S1-C subfamily serine protease